VYVFSLPSSLKGNTLLLRTKTNTLNQANDPPAKAQQTTTSSQTGTGSAGQANMGVGLYAVILIGGALAFFGYQYMQQSQQKA